VITGLAHTGVCVPDCDAAVAYYRDVPDPAMKAAILGFGDDGDRVLEVIEYLRIDGAGTRRTAGLADHGLTHVAHL
jgi:hypothetical protein